MITLTILAGSIVSVTVSGAAAGKNGTYYLDGGIITMQLSTVPNSWQFGAWKEQLPTNIGWVTTTPNGSDPGHAVFLEYDKNNQLIPGQCVQVINSPNSHFNMQVPLNSGGTHLTPGQAAYFTTSTNVADIVFTSTPCSSSASSMMLFGRDISYPRQKGNSTMPWVMLGVIIFLLLLVALLTKRH